MFSITPDMVSVIGQLEDAVAYSKYTNTVSIFAGRISVSTYCSILGGPVIDLSNNVNSHSAIPDDHIVVAISNNDAWCGSLRLANDGTYADGRLGRTPTRFRMINIAEYFAKGETLLRIPHLAMAIGINRQEVANTSHISVRVNYEDFGSNLIGSVVVPVVNNNDEKTSYFINSFGKTFEIPTRTSEETSQPAGLYTWHGGNQFTYLGAINEFIFENKESLKREVVLYHSRKDADKYSTSLAIYESLDASAKALASEREKELTTLKSDTARLDNESKVDTIRAKAEYETSSIGRKDSQEEVSYGRNITLGLVAAGTAAMTLVSKLGFTTSLGDVVIGTSVPIIPIAGLLLGLSITQNIIPNLADAVMEIGRVAKGVVSSIVDIARDAISATCSIVASGLRSIAGIIWT